MRPRRCRSSLPGAGPPLRAAASLAGWLTLGFAPGAGAGEELRALWVDAFHDGFKSPQQTAQLVADARAGNFNALFVEVRKRGDAYYDSTLEPKAIDVSPPDYDPLADLVALAHAGPEPLQVHAWIVTYNIWNSADSAPPQPDHPFNLHPDWLTANDTGDQWDGANYQFDPALPAVQQHTFDVVNDLVSRYAVDGIHFDYLRYSDGMSPWTHNVWGYHPQAVARFNALHGRSGMPAADDPEWLDFRRDQVTALVRKTWLSVRALRPEVCVSAACIAWGDAPYAATAEAFTWTSAYRSVLQDWRGWLEEGILDLAIPMVYRSHDTALGAEQFAGWVQRTREYQYDRSAAVGVGLYLNSIADSLEQITITRDPEPAAVPTVVGLAGYSYAVTNDAAAPRQAFLDALADPAIAELYTPGQPPLFAEPAQVPPQPWKSDPAVGHLLGFATRGFDDHPLDGAEVLLSGPVTRSFRSDGTGFMGTVGLPPGDYLLRVSSPGLPDFEQLVTVTGGEVTTVEALLGKPLVIDAITALEDPLRVVITWRTRPGHSYAVEAADDLQGWSTLASGIPAEEGGVNSFEDAPPASARRRYYRIVESGP